MYWYITLNKNDGHNEILTLRDPETGEPRKFRTHEEAMAERNRKAELFPETTYTVVLKKG